MRSQLLSIHSKIHVLETYWDKTIGKAMHFSAKAKDPKVSSLIKQLISVPREVRYAALKHFVNRCLDLHAIAFFQHRLLYPGSSEPDEYILEERIEYRLEKMYEKSQKSRGVKAGALPEVLVEKFGFGEQEEKPYLINHFAQLGLNDPFPGENQFE